MKVLVAEDEIGIRTMVASFLKRVGYDIIDVKDGAEALHLLQGGLVVDALITDIRMPGADGWTVAQAYRGQFPDLPVLYITGQADEMLPVPGGVIIRKPFRMSQLLPVLSKLTGPADLQPVQLVGAA